MPQDLWYLLPVPCPFNWYRWCNGPYAMGRYEVTADCEHPMMFRVCLSAVKNDQWLPPKMSHVGVFDVTCIRYRIITLTHPLHWTPNSMDHGHHASDDGVGEMQRMLGGVEDFTEFQIILSAPSFEAEMNTNVLPAEVNMHQLNFILMLIFDKNTSKHQTNWKIQSGDVSDDQVHDDLIWLRLSPNLSGI
ncbi:unnamed protein product [Larinioides sclopetarius]|uniref:Uncharacterized protein n=1 Tax=Larinioides sclopetarius TaxID=280406 RepID=A0AAV1Z1J9_9ARAC